MDNYQSITDVQAHGRIRAYCPLGRAWYTADVTVTVVEPLEIPDYCELDAAIGKMDGQALLIEDVADQTFAMALEAFDPAECRVDVAVGDAAHMPVTVTKRAAGLHD